MQLMRSFKLCGKNRNSKMSAESSKAQELLFEFPILMEESNELVTLFLNAEDAEKARNGKNKHVFIFS